MTSSMGCGTPPTWDLSCQKKAFFDKLAIKIEPNWLNRFLYHVIPPLLRSGGMRS